MNEKDYYAILGVSEDASSDEIRRAFQKTARTLHPDVNKEPDAEEKFKEVSEAYAVLSDPDKRARYDAMRSGNPFAAGWGGSSTSSYPSSGGGYSGSYTGSSYDDPFMGWGFPFGMGGFRTSTTSSRAYRPREGADFVYDVRLDEQTAEQGTKRGLTYQHYVGCSVCGGKGSVASEVSETCPTCGGTGHMTIDMQDLLGFGVMNITCPECEGTGKVVANPCSACGGSGRVLSSDEIVVDIPAGSYDGKTVRVPGRGNAGTNGKEAGDFVLRVQIPEQRLSMRDSAAFNLIGFSSIFLILGLLVGNIWSYSSMIIFPIAIALYLLFSGSGLSGRSQSWWRNAGRALANGFMNGLPFIILLLLPSMCSAAFRR